jgi:hypothetical protein
VVVVAEVEEEAEEVEGDEDGDEVGGICRRRNGRNGRAQSQGRPVGPIRFFLPRVER